jgi:hypothetical protein
MNGIVKTAKEKTELRDRNCGKRGQLAFNENDQNWTEKCKNIPIRTLFAEKKKRLADEIRETLRELRGRRRGSGGRRKFGNRASGFDDRFESRKTGTNVGREGIWITMSGGTKLCIEVRKKRRKLDQFGTD